MKRARCTFWVLAMLCLGTSQAVAGKIHGTLHVGKARAMAGGARSRLHEGPRSPRDPVLDAVVYLERIPDKLEKKLAKKSLPASVVQAHGRFSPSSLPVAQGTTVTFENRDNVYHNVFSVSSARRFDIGKYPPRASRAVRFDRPGIVRLFCDIDPGEAGYICVTPNHAFTRPDSSGAFELPKLPRGSYRLRAWHPVYGSTVRDIEMPRRGDVSVDLRL